MIKRVKLVIPLELTLISGKKEVRTKSNLKLGKSSDIHVHR